MTHSAFSALLAPLAVSMIVAAIATSAHRRLPPRLATRFVTIALVIVVAAALPTTIIIALAYLAHVPVIGTGARWCAQVFGIHQSVPGWIGLPAVMLVGWSTFRIGRLIGQHRRLRVDEPSTIRIAHSHSPYAVTLPGRAGQIVLSSALIEILEPHEQQVVIAHERAHARYRHDRYLLTAELAAAILPPLRALARRVSFSVERWADESAARMCGDRQLVAITLGKVAVQAHPSTVAGFSGLGVAARMEALLEPPIPTPRRRHVLGLWASLVVTAAFSAYQLHHVEHLIAALCPH